MKIQRRVDVLHNLKMRLVLPLVIPLVLLMKNNYKQLVYMSMNKRTTKTTNKRTTKSTIKRTPKEKLYRYKVFYRQIRIVRNIRKR